MYDVLRVKVSRFFSNAGVVFLIFLLYKISNVRKKISYVDINYKKWFHINEDILYRFELTQ